MSSTGWPEVAADREMAATGTRYRMLETIRQYAAGRLAEAGGTEATRRRHATRSWRWQNGNARSRCCRVIMTIPRRAGRSLRTGDEAGPRLARALGGFWLARGFWREARDWLERALAPARPMSTCVPTCSGCSGPSCMKQATGVKRRPCCPGLCRGPGGWPPGGGPGADPPQAHRDPLLEGGGSLAQSLAECKAALATLETEGDLEGMAEAWLTIGLLHLNLGDSVAEEDFERAVDCARRSGHHSAELKASAVAGLQLHPGACSGRCSDRPRRAAARCALQRPLGGSDDTRAAFGPVCVCWPPHRRPRRDHPRSGRHAEAGARLERALADGLCR